MPDARRGLGLPPPSIAGPFDGRRGPGRRSIDRSSRRPGGASRRQHGRAWQDGVVAIHSSTSFKQSAGPGSPCPASSSMSVRRRRAVGRKSDPQHVVNVRGGPDSLLQVGRRRGSCDRSQTQVAGKPGNSAYSAARRHKPGGNEQGPAASKNSPRAGKFGRWSAANQRAGSRRLKEEVRRVQSQKRLRRLTGQPS